MKSKKLAPLLAVSMSLQLILSPLAHAQDKGKNNGGSVAETIYGLVGVSAQLYGQYMASKQPHSPHFQTDMSQMRQQQTPQPDKYFNPQKMSQIPGLMNYLALNNINPQMLSCATLPTTMFEAHNEVCRVGITMDKGNPQSQMAEMLAYGNQYTQISKVYKNYSVDSNSGGQLFGVGCMKNAMQILNGFFRYRLDELDKLSTNLEAMNNSFREASRSDLDAIEESTAVLDGGNSELADGVRTKKPDLFDFGKRFDNPACVSMMDKEKFNEMGKGNGLNSIREDLNKTMTKQVGSSSLSGESYMSTHNSVVDDIKKMAEKVSKQVELQFDEVSSPNGGYGKFVNGIKGQVSSAYGSNELLNAGFFSDLQTKFKETNDNHFKDINEIGRELGEDPNELFSGLGSASFESDVVTIENRIKNSCLRQNAQVNEALARVHDPNASDFANKNASNFIKDRIKKIMDDNNTSLEQKMAELQALESKGSRFQVKMENAYEVAYYDKATKTTQKKVVPATAPRSPSAYFADHIRHCEAKFHSNSKNNKLTAAKAIERLRQLKGEHKALAKKHAQDVREEIQKKMIECKTPVVANNSISGSCTPDRFNTTSPNFCANAALSCSKNMQACFKQADKFVTEIKKDRTARVNNYKKLVQKNKSDIVRMFDTALSRYMREAELLRGTFGAGFSSPQDIKREVPEGDRYLNKFKQATANSPDGAMLLEDPDKYVSMFRANIVKLKASVEAQQSQILGDGIGSNRGLLAEHVNKTEKNYRDAMKDSDSLARRCMDKHDGALMANENERKQQMMEQQKKNQEMGEHRQDFCGRWGQAQEHPGPACKGNIDDITRTVTRLGYEGQEAANKFKELCDRTQVESGSRSSLVVKAIQICPTDIKEVKDTAKLEGRLDKQQERSEAAESKLESAKTKVKEKNDKITILQEDFDQKNAHKGKIPVDEKNRAAQETAQAALDGLSLKIKEAKLELENLKAAEDKIAKEFEKISGEYKTAQTNLDETNETNKKIEETTKSSDEMTRNCAYLLGCRNESTIRTGVGETERVSCSSEGKEAAATKILVASGQMTLDPDWTPSFCPGGNMDGRNNWKDMLQNGGNIILGQNPGAIGQ